MTNISHVAMLIGLGLHTRNLYRILEIVGLATFLAVTGLIRSYVQKMGWGGA
jgi:hypothetical protein